MIDLMNDTPGRGHGSSHVKKLEAQTRWTMASISKSLDCEVARHSAAAHVSVSTSITTQAQTPEAKQRVNGF